MLSKAEKEALRLRHPAELTNEELWEAHGPWVKTLARRAARRYSERRVTLEELWGVGYEVMAYSAKGYDPAKGKFTSFITSLVLMKMNEYIWRCYSANRPRPKNPETPDPCQGIVNWDKTLAKSLSKDTDGPRGQWLLAQITEAHENLIRGNCTAYSMNPERATASLETIQKVLKVLDKMSQGNEVAKVKAARVRRVVEDGELASDVAKDLGLSQAAVQQDVRDVRLMVQGLSLEEVTALRTDRRRVQKKIREAA